MLPSSVILCFLYQSDNGNSEEPMVVAKYDYKARDKQELDISKNEKLILLDDSKHWWMVSVPFAVCIMLV